MIGKIFGYDINNKVFFWWDTWRVKINNTNKTAKEVAQIIKAIGEFLGHGNLSTTKRYAHPDERIKQNVMETYEKLINNGDKTKKRRKRK